MTSKIVVITGGSAGVGRAAVREFAHAGYDVAILARGDAGLAAASDEVRDAGRRALAISVDVSDAEGMDAAAERVEAELGPVQVWVNCAFVGSLAYFWDTTPEEFRRITEVTYYGQVYGTRAALRLMRQRDHGMIVNVSSAMAHRGIPLQSAYCGAKHAIKGFTESVITELRSTGSGVRIGMVTLPGLNTVQFEWNLNKMPEHPMPVPPIYQPEVAGRAIRHAAEHRRRDVWVGVPTAYTILGNRLAPRIMDWYLGKSGIGSQQTQQRAPRHGSNLFRVRDESADRGAHGPFDEQAHPHDPVSFVGRNRVVTGIGGLAGVLAGAVLVRRRRRDAAA